MAKANTQLRKLIRETPLAELVDVGVLQRMQDRFAEVTGVSVVIRDLQGRPVTRPSCQNAFCSLMSGFAIRRDAAAARATAGPWRARPRSIAW